MSHIHIIDGKSREFSNSNCPICGKAPADIIPSSEVVEFPKVYRKGNTVVVRLSKRNMVALTYWKDSDVYSLTQSKAIVNRDGKVVTGKDGKPLWNRMTSRMNVAVLKDFVTQISILIQDVSRSSNVPSRD